MGLVVCGCVPDLSPWQLGSAAFDAGPFVPPSDGSVLPPVTTGGPCPAPSLLLSVEDLEASGAAGRVLRFSLATESMSRCGDITGRDELDGQPFSVTGDDRLVVVASRDGVEGVEPLTDRVAWRNPAEGHPNDAFLWQDPASGESLYVIAWGGMGCSGLRCFINVVTAYDTSGAIRYRFGIGGLPLPVSSSPSMTRDPVDPTRVLALHPSLWAAAQVDLVGNSIERDPSYVVIPAGSYLRTIYAFETDTNPRFAWTGTQDSVEHAFYLNDQNAGTLGQNPSSVARCDCELAHVVPDPTRPWGMIGLCVRDGIVRDVVRFRSTGDACDVVLPGSSLGYERISYLAIAR